MSRKPGPPRENLRLRVGQITMQTLQEEANARDPLPTDVARLALSLGLGILTADRQADGQQQQQAA